MKWFVVENSEIHGHTESSNALAPPPDEGIRSYPEATDSDLDEYRAAKNAISLEKRSDLPGWDGNQVVLPPDTRPKIRVTSSRAPDPSQNAIILDADGADTIDLTFTALNADGTVNTSPNGTKILTLFYELTRRRYKLTFVNGVSTKTIKAKNPGEYLITSYDDLNVESDLLIYAVE